MNFPEDYPSATLRGQTVEFKIYIIDIQGAEIFAADDPSYLESKGVDTLEQLHDQTKKQLTTELSSRLDKSNLSEMFDALQQMFDFTPPEGMVSDELKLLTEQFRKHRDLDADAEISADDLNKLNDRATQSVKLALIIESYRRKFGMTLDAKLMEEQFQEQSILMCGNTDMVDYLKKNNQVCEDMFLLTIEKMIAEKIYQLAKVTETPTTLADLDNSQEKTQD